MKAVILAAGKGTRLGELTKNIPKPMVQVAGKPVVEHVMRAIQTAGIDDFILVTKYLSEKIEEYFGDGSQFGMRVQYVKQGGRYGTGAALFEARELVGNSPLMMTFADVVVSTQNYKGAFDVFLDWRGAGVITLNEVPDPCTGADVKLDAEGRISRIIEKPPPGTAQTYLNSSGLFVFHPIVFDYLERLEPSARGEYELPDAMNAMASDGLMIYPYYLQGFWRDVGTIADIAAAEELMKSDD